MSEPAAIKKKGIGSKALGIVGCIAGAAIGKYSGIYLLFPLFATAGVRWASTKLLKDDQKIIVSALSVNAGHFLWLALVVALVGDLSLSFVDFALYIVGLVWLVKKPSTGPLYLLAIYLVLSLASTGYSFADAAVGSGLHKALLVYLIWRAMALFLVIKLLMSFRKQQIHGNASVAP